MAQWRWFIAAASVPVGVVLLALLVHPFVGSGRSCDGLGFGCTPERATDTLLVVAVYSATAMATLALTWRRACRGRTSTAVLYVRASSYISELEITASTGCHRG